jgi:branched-chain amino acid transport system substrate-binding protein
MLVVASGSGAAMPQMGLVERGYKGKVYQTHAAATPDLARVGGKSVEGTFVVSGPALLGDQLPDNHPSKKLALDFVQKFEKEFGANSRNQFAGHSDGHLHCGVDHRGKDDQRGACAEHGYSLRN